MARSQKAIFVGDHTKMVEVGGYRSVPFGDIEILVTDQAPIEPAAECLRQAGTMVVYPDMDEDRAEPSNIVAVEGHSDAH